MNEFPIWLLTLLSHLRTLFLAALDLITWLLTLYMMCIDYTVDCIFSIFGPLRKDYFMEWSVGSFNLEGSNLTRDFDDAIPYIAAAAHVLQATSLMVVIWFLAFLLPFSHWAVPSATNEYLLFACILFSLFLVYGRVAGLASDATSPVEAIEQEIHRQTSRKLDACLYHSETGVEYVTAVTSFEELLAVATDEVEATSEADDVLFEDALSSSALHSLNALVYEEVAIDLLDLTFEEMEDSDVQLEEIVDRVDGYVPWDGSPRPLGSY